MHPRFELQFHLLYRDWQSLGNNISYREEIRREFKSGDMSELTLGDRVFPDASRFELQFHLLYRDWQSLGNNRSYRVRTADEIRL